MKMNYVVFRFLRMMVRDYGFDFTIIENNRYKTECIIAKIPLKLLDILKDLHYEVPSRRIMHDSSGNLIKDFYEDDKLPVCQIIKLPDGTSGISVVFDDNSAAKKMNKLAIAIREYFCSNSMIKSIKYTN